MTSNRDRPSIERWRLVEHLYHAALEPAPAERPAFLERACAGDEWLRHEVESLLAHADAASHFMEEPAIGLAARQLAEGDRGARNGPPVLVGDRIGVYEVIAPLGAGGMGEVYQANDPRLGRTVAIKIIRGDDRADPAASERFEREARTLASLSHPHICPIFDVGRHEGLDYFVMEYLEGQTLEARLARGSLPIDRALKYAIEMVEGLEWAHRHGIVHRDLKPANVMLTRAGVKLLDFGLARRRSALAPLVRATAADDVAVTLPGIVVGTVPYMAPERLEGHEGDARSDLFAAGAVLHEMLTGRRAFAGEDQARVMGAILERDPEPVSASRPEVSREIDRVVQTCLAKDPDERWQSATDLKRELRRIAGQSSSGARTAVPLRTRAGFFMPALAGAAVIVAMPLAWYLGRTAEPRRPVTRSTLSLPAGMALDTRGRAAPLAISPDGRRVVYAADGGDRIQLYVRNLDAFEAEPIAGTDGAHYPVFSPDGQSIAFFAGGRLQRVPLEGGKPVPVCRTPSLGRGGTWGPDATIVFAGETGLFRVSAAGGTPARLTSRDADVDSQVHSWPQFLPGGHGVLSTIGLGSNTRLAVLSLETRRWHVLGPGDGARFLPPDLLVFHGGSAVREGELFAMRFDPRRLSARGAPVAVMSGVFRGQAGSAAYFALADTGTLVFGPGGLARTLVRVDRNGRRTALANDRRGFRFPRVSPDGRLVAVTIDPRPSEIWIHDVVRQSRWRLGAGIAPVWTPDGTRITYQAPGAIVWQSAEGRGAAATLLPAGNTPQDWSPDGRTLLFVRARPAAAWDIWALPREGSARPLVATSASEVAPAISPDGRWLAFQSDESGRSEVYVTPFPAVGDGKWTVSTDGGDSPRWSPDGRELFYMDGTALMAVPVSVRNGRFTPGAPVRLFDGPFDTTNVRNFDVMPDGRHFVMVEADPEARPDRLHVVQNWGAEITARMDP